MKDGRIRELSIYFICKQIYSVRLLNSLWVLLLVLYNSQAIKKVPYKMSASAACGSQLYFYRMILMCREIDNENLNIINLAVNSTPVGKKVQPV